jgi:hypothetical protein
MDSFWRPLRSILVRNKLGVSTEGIENTLSLEVARPERFELPTLWFEARCSDPLSYGRVRDIIASSLFAGTYL